MSQKVLVITHADHQKKILTWSKQSPQVKLLYHFQDQVPQWMPEFSRNFHRVIIHDDLYDIYSSHISGHLERLSQIKADLLTPTADLNLKTGYQRYSDALNRPIVFVPLNDFHVRILIPIAKKLPNSYFLLIRSWKSAQESLDKEKIKYLLLPNWVWQPDGYRSADQSIINRWANRYFDFPMIKIYLQFESQLSELEPAAIVNGADWSTSQRVMCEWAKRKEIPTISIQEDPQDFYTSARGSQHSEFAFVQGPISVHKSERTNFFITGSPRFDELAISNKPQHTRVMVNANYTSGLYENWAKNWMKDIVSVLRKLGVDFFVSRHPRDHFDYGDIPTEVANPQNLQEQIEKSSIVISRYSQIVYESIARGRSVIYYDPYREETHPDILLEGQIESFIVENSANVLRMAKNPEDLNSIICQIMTAPENDELGRKKFLSYLFNYGEGSASSNAAEALGKIILGYY